MQPRSDRQQVGGSAVHVGDAHIWAAISYLDSSTGYRECLPNSGYRDSVVKADMVMLDRPDEFSRIAGRSLAVLGFVGSVLLLLVLRFCS